MTTRTSRPRIGYVLKVFPRLSETFILNEILALEKLGLEVEIFSLNPPGDPRFHGALSLLRGEVSYLPRADSSDMWRTVRGACNSLELDTAGAGSAFLLGLRRKDADGLKLLLQGLWLAAAVHRRKIDHLHAHFATSATAAAMTAHMLSGVSFSFTAHAKDIYHEELDRLLLTEALGTAAFVVTVTDQNVTRLQEFSPRASAKVRRIYNGVPLASLVPVPEPEADPPRIVSVGRLVEKKGFAYLIEACRLLRDRGLRFQCSITGGGELDGELRAMVARLALSEFVSLEGPQQHQAVVKAVRESRLVALPCIVGEDGNRDALPTVLLEAMALGRPVVSTDLPGVTEIVDHGVTGLLVPQRDAASLADALERLLGDPALCAAFGRAGRLKAEHTFDLQQNVSQLAELFEEAIDGPGAKCHPEGSLSQCA